MSYISLENFKFGLDARRSELTAQAGTLLVLDNAHVNQGGEIEKRKAFVRLSDPGLPTTIVQGLEEASIVNGNAISNQAVDFEVGGVAASNPLTAVSIDDAALAVYDNAILVESCNFGGKTFCIVRLQSGEYALFWDYLPVPDSIYGQVFTGYTATTDVAGHIYLAALAALAAEGYTITSVGSTVDIKAPLGKTFTTAVEYDTASTGIIGYTKMSDGKDAVAGSSAFCTVILTGVGGSVDQITVPGLNGVGTITLLASPVSWLQSNEVTADLVVNAINTHVTTPKYTAVNRDGGAFDIVAPVGTAYNGLNKVQVDYTVGTSLGINTSAIPFTATITPSLLVGDRTSSVAATVYTNANFGSNSRGYAICRAAGGTPPYHFKWTKVNESVPTIPAGSKSMIKDHDATVSPVSEVGFSAIVAPDVEVGAMWSCSVTDSSAPPITVPARPELGVSLRCNLPPEP